MIKNTWPNFSSEEIDAVREVLLSGKVNYWTGDNTKSFEKEFAEYCGTKYAVALSNGTVALELALKAIGIKENDEVIVTPRSFIASVSSVVNMGAKPVFVDIDLETQNIDPKQFKEKISSNTKAIIAVHLAGLPCNMDEIMKISNQNEIIVIEDCSQAHGAEYKGKPVGSIGHIGCWSFCQDKIISTGGEGGMVTTNNSFFWNKIWSYKDHGKDFNVIKNQNNKGSFNWVHSSFGSNFRMTEMQSVIGRIQLRKLNEWQEKRSKNLSFIYEKAKKIDGLIVPIVPDYVKHGAYRCYLFVDQKMLKEGWSRDRIIDEVKNFDVPCFSGSCPEIYLEKAFENTDFKPKNRLKNAKLVGEISIAFLTHPNLTFEELNHSCSVLSNVMQMAIK